MTDCPICLFGTVTDSSCDTCGTEFCEICAGTTRIAWDSPRRWASCSCDKNIRIIKDFPCYCVHRDGRVFRTVGPKRFCGEVKAFQNRNGYIKIKLRHNGTRRTFWLHRLVCETFHGEPPVYGEEIAHCRHKDADRTNNNADNLQWGSRADNERDKKRFHGGLGIQR